MLTNNGSYFYNNPDTKYRGLFFYQKKADDFTLFKTIDFIDVGFVPEEIINDFNQTILRSGDKEVIFDFEGGFIIKPKNTKIKIVLDIREIYDFSDNGREYNIYREEDSIVVEYKKNANDVHFTEFLVFNGNVHEFTPINKWVEVKYEEDERRKSKPSSLYVYEGFYVSADKLTVGFSQDKNLAIQVSRKTYEHNEEEDYKLKKINQNKDVLMAYNCAMKSFRDLYVKQELKGYYAGLPWFFQFWTRDESVAIKSLIETSHLELARKLLMRKVREINERGRVPNRYPNSVLGTADGTGWTFLRLHELMTRVGEVDKLFSHEEVEYINEQVKKSIDLHIKNFSEGLLIRNDANETWMDTSFENDSRSGFRIEIQALFLAILRFSNYLDTHFGREQKYAQLEMDTKNKVVEVFFKDNKLKDGSDDETIRPNIFLAYYVYPELLNKHDWIKVFDNTLDRLWLDWGGIATIDKSSKLFCDTYSGEDNRSYHRGDSWYYINNIAAICMADLNYNKYEQKIMMILKSSINDILWEGIIGKPSELSSAKKQTSEGSLYQLWSATTFIELAQKMR